MLHISAAITYKRVLEKKPWKPPLPPDPKPNPIPNLTLTLPLTTYGGIFSKGDFCLTPIQSIEFS